MTFEEAEALAEMPEATPEGCDRKSQESGGGASNVTVCREPSWIEVEKQANSDTFNALCEPPYTEPYVRRYGKTAGVIPPPSRSNVGCLLVETRPTPGNDIQVYFVLR